MKLRKWMGITALLALLTWLAIPAVRVWRKPNERWHSHVLTNLDTTKRLEMIWHSRPDFTRMTARVFTIKHKSPFWIKYRTMLLGFGWPPGDRCEDWQSFRVLIKSEGEMDKYDFDKEFEEDQVSLNLNH